MQALSTIYKTDFFRCQINLKALLQSKFGAKIIRKSVITIQIWFHLTRFRKRCLCALPSCTIKTVCRVNILRRPQTLHIISHIYISYIWRGKWRHIYIYISYIWHGKMNAYIYMAWQMKAYIYTHTIFLYISWCTPKCCATKTKLLNYLKTRNKRRFRGFYQSL